MQCRTRAGELDFGAENTLTAVAGRCGKEEEVWEEVSAGFYIRCRQSFLLFWMSHLLGTRVVVVWDWSVVMIAFSALQ